MVSVVPLPAFSQAWISTQKVSPGRMLVAESTPPDVRQQLQAMGYTLTVERLTSGPITAIFLDRKHGTMWGGASNHGEDYGIGW